MAIATIILIDLVLAGDNALVIGMAAARLPPHLKRRAIIWGTVGAIAVRVVCIAAVTWLMMIPGLRLVGGLALVWIAWRLAFDSKEHEVRAATGFWSAMSTIVIADAVMGFDNALAIAAAAQGDWYLIMFGLIVSIPLVIVGAEVISRLLARWPSIVFLGSFALFAVALKMILKDPWMTAIYDFNGWEPWMFAALATYAQWVIKRGWPMGLGSKLKQQNTNGH